MLEDPWHVDSLASLFRSSLLFDDTRGVDRVSPAQLAQRLDEELPVISRKVRDRSYRFAPFVQTLRSKGATKPPREICVPTARDRLVLLRLKELLHEAFPEHVPKTLPNAMVRAALKALAEAEPRKHKCIRLDVRNFYGSVEHDALLRRVATRLPPEATELVRRAIRNPAVPIGSRRSTTPRKPRSRGVPQGLSVSNVLADIYLGDFDGTIRASTSAYFRFVDDVLVIAEGDQCEELIDLVADEVRSRGLEIHDVEAHTAKGGIFEIDERIEFLGYVFDGGSISVRPSSVDRFLDHVAARVTRFAREQRRREPFPDWLTPEVRRRVLIEELNERITGATSGKRRYGWVFYFSALNDLSVLFEMDAAVEAIVRRLPLYAKGRPLGLKRLARTYHEVVHRPQGTYVHNYDRISTTKQRLDFLSDRGQIGPDELLSEEQVNALFERYRRQQLAQLEADLSLLS